MKKLFIISLLSLILGFGVQASAQSYTPPPGNPTNCILNGKPVEGCYPPINISATAQVKKGNFGLFENKYIEWGSGLAKRTLSGMIGYNFMQQRDTTRGAIPYLDILGAAKDEPSPRIVKIWDNLIVAKDLVADTINANKICVGTGASKVCVTDLTNITTGGTNVCGSGSKYDLNGDGIVNATDATLLGNCINQLNSCTATIRAKADLNGDGKVDARDATLENAQVSACQDTGGANVTEDNSVIKLLAGKACPDGEYLSGFDDKAGLICKKLSSYTASLGACANGKYLSGYSDDGKIVCKDLPSSATETLDFLGVCNTGEYLAGYNESGKVCRKLTNSTTGATPSCYTSVGLTSAVTKKTGYTCVNTGQPNPLNPNVYPWQFLCCPTSR